MFICIEVEIVLIINKEKLVECFSDSTIDIYSYLEFSQLKEISFGNKFYYKVTHERDLLLKKLSNKIVQYLPTNNASVGYEKDKSYQDWFLPHLKSQKFLRLDISNFFHSIDKDMVSSAIAHHFGEVRNVDFPFLSDADILACHTTVSIPSNSKNIDCRGRRILPVGLRTSPRISNIVFRSIDILIQKFCSRHGILYSRYADDMLFSDSDRGRFLFSDSFLKEISILLWTKKFRLNAVKTIRSSDSFSINGYIIENGFLRVSNKKLKDIERISYKIEKGIPFAEILKKESGLAPNKSKLGFQPKEPFVIKYLKDQMLNRLQGNRSYIISLLKYGVQNDSLSPMIHRKYLAIINRLERNIDRINR